MRVAVYVRVSTQRQAQSSTIEQQLERLRTHCQAQGWSLPDENIFRDDGYSGAALNRPGLDRLRDRIAQAEFDRLLITVPDRLARKYVHQVLLMEEFERAGCPVEFLDRPMSQDPHDQLLLQIRGAVSEYERSLIAERMRRGRYAKFRAGVLLPWTRVPYGFRVNPDRPRDPSGVRVDEPEAAIIADMFTYYAEEAHSLFGLAKHLIEIGAATPQGQKRWNQATIRGILTNPLYTGKVYAGRSRPRAARIRRSALKPIGRPTHSRVVTPSEDWILVAEVTAIVSQAQFDIVQAKLSQNQNFAKRNNKAQEYLLRALVSCGVCQASCMARTSTHAYAYYLCRGKLHPVQSCHDEKCPARFIPAHQLDDLVWRDLCEVLTQPALITQALQRAQSGDWLPQELQARRENLRKARVSLVSQLERLTEAYLGNVIPLAEYQRRRQDLEQKQHALETQAKQLDVSVNRQTELAGLSKSIQDFCERVQRGLADATFEQKRQLVELLIDRVVVTNEEVEIRYVIPTSPSSEHVRFCHLRKDYFRFIRRIILANCQTSSNTPTNTPTHTLTPTITQTPDGSPPSIDSLEINKGALTTTSTNVILDLAAHDPTDGIAEMSFSHDQSNWSAWQPFTNTVAWTLEAGDGIKTVYARVRDFAGNLSPISSATIQLDTSIAPEFSVSVNQGALYTNQTSVMLTIGARPFTSKMEVSNDGGFNVPQEPYSAQKDWTITAYDGSVLPRTVYVRFRDRDGTVVGTATDDIILDVNAPTGSVSIGNTSEPENPAAGITLKLNATDDLSGVGDMRISNNSSFAGAIWEPYSPTRNWALVKNKVAFVQYRDNAGNISKTYATTTCTTASAKPHLIAPKKGSTVNNLQVALDWTDAKCGTTFSLVVKQDSQTGRAFAKSG